MKGFTHPVKVTCEDHEGNGRSWSSSGMARSGTSCPTGVQRCATSYAPRSRRRGRQGKKLGYTMRDCKQEK